MSVYTPAPGDIIYPGAAASTELGSRVQGFIAGCGWAGLDVVLNAVNGTPTTIEEVTQIIWLAIAQHQTVGLGGVSTPSNIINIAKNDFGVSIQSLSWQTALQQYAGIKPIELGIGNATVFGGSDSKVRGHYITVVGRTVKGDYIVSDPNTPQSRQGQFVTYSPQQLANASIFWAGVPTNPLGNPGVGAGLGGLLQPLQGIQAILQGFLTPFQAVWNVFKDWLTNPARVAKLMIGIALIATGIWIGFTANEEKITDAVSKAVPPELVAALAA